MQKWLRMKLAINVAEFEYCICRETFPNCLAISLSWLSEYLTSASSTGTAGGGIKMVCVGLGVSDGCRLAGKSRRYCRTRLLRPLLCHAKLLKGEGGRLGGLSEGGRLATMSN